MNMMSISVRTRINLFATDYANFLDSADRIAIIADEHVAAIHLPLLQQALEAAKREIVVKTVPSGENCKTPAVYIDVFLFIQSRTSRGIHSLSLLAEGLVVT